MKKISIKVGGMHCTSCEKLIEDAARQVEGVAGVKADYAAEKAEVEFDEGKTGIEKIMKAIEGKGYECSLAENAVRPGEQNGSPFSTKALPTAKPLDEQNTLREQNESPFSTKALPTAKPLDEQNTLRQEKGVTDAEEILPATGEEERECAPAEDGVKANEGNGHKKTIAGILAVIGLLVAGFFAFHLVEGMALPEISANMGYGLLFVVGLLTGFHCVAMCGGFVVSYTAKHAQEGSSAYKSHLAYGVGKTISYTVIGAAFGLLGSIIAFTPEMRGAAGIIAGIFLMVFGLKMLNVFPWLRKFSIRAPSFVNKFVGKESQHSSPLVIGLLNGLMIACGPLQAIYIMAAGTGSAVEGAKLLFVFALGTLPVMLGFGAITTMISRKATHTILKASGAIVIILGLLMLNNGLALTGTGLDAHSLLSSAAPAVGGTQVEPLPLAGGYQVIEMNVTRQGWEPDTFVLRKGVPVKWVINGKEINGCNRGIQVPKLGLKFSIKPGLQTIEFTPQEAGTIPWSCWMGMIQGTFIVNDGASSPISGAAVQKELAAAKPQPGGSCSMASGGGCGCMG